MGPFASHTSIPRQEAFDGEAISGEVLLFRGEPSDDIKRSEPINVSVACHVLAQQALAHEWAKSRSAISSTRSLKSLGRARQGRTVKIQLGDGLLTGSKQDLRSCRSILKPIALA